MLDLARVQRHGTPRAADRDEIKTAARLFVLNGLALTAVAVLFRNEFLPERGSALGFTITVATMTIVMAIFHLLQERRRPTPSPTDSPMSPTTDVAARTPSP